MRNHNFQVYSQILHVTQTQFPKSQNYNNQIEFIKSNLRNAWKTVASEANIDHYINHCTWTGLLS